MNEPTNIQIISQDGHPAFVVIPYDEYVRTFRKTPRITAAIFPTMLCGFP